MAIPFTQNSLKKLLGTTGKREVIHDPQNKGLRCELREGGGMAFYIFARIPGGGPTRYRIGAFPAVTVEEARKQAKAVLSKLAGGNDVAAVRREERGEMTFGELFHNHWLPHAKRSKKTWKKDEWHFDYHLAHWAKRKLSKISRQDVKALHTAITTKGGKYIANRVVEYVSAFYGHAIREELYNGTNPAAAIKGNKEEPRDRFLQPDELPRFMAAVEAEPNSMLRDFFKMCLFTGARKHNVLSMRWDEISIELETWRIPDTKQGKPQFVVLSKPALKILQQRQKRRKESPYVFPSPESASGHLEDPMRPWRRVLKKAGVENFRLHDLRRTFGSYQALSGASLAIIGKTLGHTQQSTTAVYARLTDGAVKESVTTAVNAMLKAAAVKGGAK